MFTALLETNRHLIGTLEAAPAERLDAEALTQLLEARVSLLRALQEAGAPAPEALRPMLQAQHQRLDTLLASHRADLTARLSKIERFEQAQASYAPPAGRQVLRSGLNF